MVLVLISVITMAQDKTKTKNNEAGIYDNLNDIYVEIKKHRVDSTCLQLADSMRKLAIQQGDKRAIAMSYAHPLSYYLNKEDEPRFLQGVEQLMKASEEAELWSFYYFALSQKSIFLLRQNRVAETIEMAETMMKKAYDENNKNGIYTSHSILVNCYEQLRLYDEGLVHAEKALQVEIGLPDNLFGNSLTRMGELYLLKRDYQGGLDAINKYGHLVKNQSSMVRILEYKALYNYWLDRKEEFSRAYKEVLEAYETYGMSSGTNPQILKVLDLHVKGQNAEAEKEALLIPRHGQGLNLIKLYKDTKNTDLLYSLLLAVSNGWQEAHEQLYEADLKKFTLELDNHNLKLKEQEMLENQRSMRIYLVLAVFVVMLLFGCILYWREQRSNRQLQKANTLLEEQKKQLQEQLIAVQQANMANDAKTSFLFNMSHDIRTPMNAILGFANLMEKQKDNPQMVSDYLFKIKSSGQFLLSLINNVLDMARIESGKMELDEDFYDLLATKNNTVELFMDMARRKNITLTHSGHVEHRYVMIDQMKVRQIMLNLLSNAIKYTPDGGTVTYKFEELPCEREGYATFVSTVSDNGIGMSPEYAKTIFDMFSRERNTTESKQVGTGLGMSIVKRLVDMMSGTIEVKTELGKGTTFAVTMSHPIVENPEKYLKSDLQQEELIHGVSLQGKRILLAEDNDLNAEIALAILEEVGILVEHAEDGVECVKMLVEANAGYYNAILMDVQMPNMSGYEATKAIRALPDTVKAHIPIIAMTANAFEEDKKNALEVGMNGHLAKPIVVSELMKTLASIIEG